MKLRLYRTPKCKDFVDEFTVYFPYPKWLEKTEKRHSECVACSTDIHGNVKLCNWDCEMGNERFYYGRRYPVEKMSVQFQRWFAFAQALWDKALKYNDDAHWEEFYEKVSEC